jgi:hypothetical protein
VEERESIRRLGGDIVVFYNAGIELIDAWRRQAKDLPADLTIVADAHATLYDGLGTTRGSYRSLALTSVGPLIKSAREGRFPRLTKTDMLRLGADVAVRADGEITKLHLARDPDDRMPLSELVAAL